MKRRTSIRHKVRSHMRGDDLVNQYLRGHGQAEQRRRVVVGEPEPPSRVISMSGADVEIFGELSRDGRKGLDWWIEIESMEAPDGTRPTWNEISLTVSRTYDFLMARRHLYDVEHDISEEYRNASRYVARRDYNGVVIALSAFQAELQELHKDEWRIVE